MTLIEHILNETRRQEDEWMKNAQPHVKTTVPSKSTRGKQFDIPMSDGSIEADAYFFNKPIQVGPNAQINMTAILEYRITDVWEKVYVGFFIEDMRRYAELSMQFHGQSQVMHLFISRPNGKEIESGSDRMSIMNILEWCIYHARQNGFNGVPMHKSFLADYLSD